MTDPFRALGLPADPDLSDDDVRAAWRRVAAATHPDRADGGDPATFAAAAAAYSDLRTRFGRGDALAARAVAPRPGPAARLRRGLAVAVRAAAPRPGPAARARRGLAARTLAARPTLAALLPFYRERIARGRPARLCLRLLAAAGTGALAVLAAGWRPATAGVLAGLLVWVVRAGRADLAPASRARRPWPPDGPGP